MRTRTFRALLWCVLFLTCGAANAALPEIGGTGAIGSLEVRTTNTWLNYKEVIPQAIEESLARSKMFSRLVAAARVEEKLQERPTPLEVANAAKSLNADYVLNTVLRSVDFNEESGRVLMEIETQLLSTKTGEQVASSLVRGASAEKPGYKGGPQALAQEALYNAADHAVGEIKSTIGINGTVSIAEGPSTDKLFVTLAQVNVVRVGSVIGVYDREGVKAGQLKVEDSGISQVSGKIFNRRPGARIEQGFEVRLEYIPSPSFEEHATLVEKVSPKKRKGGSSLIGILGVGAVAILLGIGQNKKDQAAGEQARIVGSVTCSNCGTFEGSGAFVTIPTTSNNVVRPVITQSSNHPPLPTNGFLNQASAVYNFGPDGLQFNTNVTLGIRFADTDNNGCVDGYTDPNDNTNGDGNAIGCVNTTNLTMYTYDPNRQEWVRINGSAVVGGTDPRVIASVNHFSLYVLLENTAPAPPLPPQNVSVRCATADDATLVWTPSPATNVAAYNVYECTSLGGGCGGTPIVGGLPSSNQTHQIGSLNSGVNKFFSVSAIDNIGQEGDRSVIAAAVASSCRVVPAPVLISPKDGTKHVGSPLLVFQGVSNNVSGYLLEIYHSTNGVNTVRVRSVEIPSTGSGGDPTTSQSVPTPVTISHLEPSETYSTGNTYRWRVCNLDATDACVSDGPPTWSPYSAFTIANVPPNEEVCDVNNFPAPTLTSPANASTFTTDTPEFTWNPVGGESDEISYRLEVKAPNGTVIFTSNTSATTIPFNAPNEQSELQNDVLYSWTVTALAQGGCSSTSQVFFFTKKDLTAQTRPTAPNWATTPLTPANQLVIIRWQPNPEANIIGYNIYRLETDSSGTADVSDLQADPATTAPIARITVDKLNQPSLNPNCPQSSTQAPIYCDESVTNGRRYFYVIRAVSQGDVESVASAPVSVQLQLERPVLISPGSVLPVEFQVPPDGQQIRFVWNEVNGADRYVVEVVDETANQLVKQDESSGGSLNIDFTVVDSHIYRWTLQAVNSLVASQVSEPLKFKIVFLNSQSLLPLVTGITATPIPVDRSIRVQWNRATDTNVIAYAVLGGPSPGELALISRVNQATTNTLSFTHENLDAGNNYFYSVLAIALGTDGDVFGPQADPVKATLPMIAPFTAQPDNGGFVSDPNPLLEWTHVPGATSYLVQIATLIGDIGLASDRIWSVVVPADSSGNNSVVFGDPDLPQPTAALINNATRTKGDGYNWRVGAINANNPNGVFRNPSTFFKFLPVPTQISPQSAGSALNVAQRFTDSNITFKWTSVAGAAQYVLRVCAGANKCDNGVNLVWETRVQTNEVIFNSDGNAQSLQNCIAVGNTCGPNNIGVYTWQVRAEDANGVQSGSGWNTLDVPSQNFIKMAPAAPVLITPLADQIILPDPNGNNCPENCQYLITFTWGSLQGAASYIIQITEEAELAGGTSPVVIFQGAASSGFQFDSGSSVVLKPMKPGAKYSWNVTAIIQETNEQLPFNPANERSFFTGLPTPNLVVPLENSLAVLNGGQLTIRFEWDPIPGATSYDLEIQNVTLGLTPLTGATAEAAGNGCKVVANSGTSSGPTFSRVSSNFYICTADETLAGFEEGHTIRWRVRAVDSLIEPEITGNPGPFSSYRNFRVGVPGPVLASPVNSPTDADEPSEYTHVGFRDIPYYWSPIPDDPAARYYFQVADDPSFLNVIWSQTGTASPPTAPFNITTAQNGIPVITGYTPHINQLKLPTINGVVYYWRVGACPSGIVNQGDCGDRNSTNWIYSPTFKYFKRPQQVNGVTYTSVPIGGGEQYRVTVNWGAPLDFDGNISTVNSSVPPIPPNGGGYMITEGTNCPADTSLSNTAFNFYNFATTTAVFDLSCDDEVTYCVRVVDDSRNISYIGSVSLANTINVTTGACPDGDS